MGQGWLRRPSGGGAWKHTYLHSDAFLCKMSIFKKKEGELLGFQQQPGPRVCLLTPPPHFAPSSPLGFMAEGPLPLQLWNLPLRALASASALLTRQEGVLKDERIPLPRSPPSPVTVLTRTEKNNSVCRWQSALLN